ncbi:DNA mismatch repair protein MutS [Metallumcola ferriviriculae]|uniref:DNA mismatch repair protein MutS n=1 Tax=Metallumcola ferriviriculae TaxID=3039180 RepID=A0AAU0UPA0_9FIRM|nr:DNA mismatch repair protein MutS [Desulfitibacteraceae bacterium MK1]
MTTPMMQQYQQIKQQYQDAILFFRLGDFYEMFGEDAREASRILEITLTTRDKDKEAPIPMCGIPYHAVNTYLGKLLNRGYKVAICEQVEDPEKSKGIVRREVVRVITPGTIIDKELLAEAQNNFLAAICQVDDIWGLAFVDVSTGEFYVTELNAGNTSSVVDEITRYNVSECLVAPDDPGAIRTLLEPVCVVTSYPPKHWSVKRTQLKMEEQFSRSGLEAAGIIGCEAAVAAGGILIAYLSDTQKQTLGHINRVQLYSPKHFMLIDGATRRNLELHTTMRTREKKGSLLWVLDKTVTALGGRLLKKFISQPLLDRNEILSRQQAVTEFVNNMFLREKLREYLKKVYDLERLVSRLVFQTANGRDLLALGQSLQYLPLIKERLEHAKTTPLLHDCWHSLDTLTDISQLIMESIKDNPPVSVTDGSLIKDGYSEEVDKLRQAAASGKKWLAQLEQEERNKTGIKSLKVKYNKVFGYYIEITKANLDHVPTYFQRKQTLANAERYITPKLKELEDTILGAEDKLVKLEYRIFSDIRQTLAVETKRIQETARVIALLDVLLSLATTAVENGYVAPKILPSEDTMEIKAGRHPVIEQLTTAGAFVPNDTNVGDKKQLIVITGPNMAGKSTYMRQVALITLMSQIGSWVPAQEAFIPLVDRIFTRVGAADDLSTGQSTFMVEMNEVANILHNATGRSLIILDEIGRGTSTYDGIAIAWAVIEFLLQEKKGAKTFFATHYHQLTALDNIYQQVANHQVAVQEKGKEIVFLRKIISGGTDKSYGIQVARLAGLPNQVIKRAQFLLTEMENQGNSAASIEAAAAKEDHLVFFEALNSSYETVLEKLRHLDVMNTTPIEALNMLSELKQLVDEGDNSEQN